MSFTRPIMIGIAGLSGSGKSTVAEKIEEKYGHECLVLSADKYYKDLPFPTVEERAAPSKDIPAAIDFDLLVEHVNKLAEGKAIEAPRYCFVTHKRLPETDTFNPAGKKFIVVESILVFCNEELVKQFHKKIFVDTSMDICLLRRILRDIAERGREIEGIRDQYLSTVRPAILDYIKPSKRHADLIVKNNESVLDVKNVKIDMQAVFDLIDPPVVRVVGAPSNSGIFSKSANDQRVQPAAPDIVAVNTLGF